MQGITSLLVFVQHTSHLLDLKDATMEQTYIMIKPDGIQRGLVAEIIKRFEQKGFNLRGLKMLNVTKEHAETHYSDLSSKYPISTDLSQPWWHAFAVIAVIRSDAFAVYRAKYLFFMLAGQVEYGSPSHSLRVVALTS
jgi:hypothetical protein